MAFVVVIHILALIASSYSYSKQSVFVAAFDETLEWTTPDDTEEKLREHEMVDDEEYDDDDDEYDDAYDDEYDHDDYDDEFDDDDDFDDEFDDHRQDAFDDEFLIPDHLSPGNMIPLYFREDGRQADTHGRLIGLPPSLTHEIQKYCDESGLTDLFWKLAYQEAVPPGRSLFYELKGGRKFAASSPGMSSNWKDSNMHWVDVTNEEMYEETLDVLKRGDFDVVLDAIGRHFDLKGLMYGGIGFVVVSHCHDGQIHPDVPGVGKDMFNLLFPLVLPQDDDAILYIGDEYDTNRAAPINFTPDVGVLMSGDTWHATGDCDYREAKGLRVSVSIFLSDINEDNVKTIAADGTSVFPAQDNVDWFLAQRGRVWGGGNTLQNDKGRKPYGVKDDGEITCPILAERGMCEIDLKGTRRRCQKSCNVYIDDERYYAEFVGTSSER